MVIIATRDLLSRPPSFDTRLAAARTALSTHYLTKFAYHGDAGVEHQVNQRINHALQRDDCRLF